MYVKARAGLIKGFTGVDDPYEVPQSAEVVIDTTHLTPDEAAREVLLVMGQKGYIQPCKGVVFSTPVLEKR